MTLFGLSIFQLYSKTPSILFTRALFLFVVKPNLSNSSNASLCERALKSVKSLTLYINTLSFRFAVNLESNCLNDPAAAFLGFANNCSSFFSFSSFNRKNDVSAYMLHHELLHLMVLSFSKVSHELFLNFR